MGRLKVLAVLLALVLGLALSAAVGASPRAAERTAKACRSGTKAAVIRGVARCLKAGQRCERRDDPRYHRLGFHCHNGRLTRARPALPAPVTLTLEPVNSSDAHGTVTLTPVNANETRLSITMNSASLVPQPAHVHLGTCAADSDIFYTLSDVKDGRSETMLGPMLQLRGKIVIVHRSFDDPVNVACGAIPRA